MYSKLMPLLQLCDSNFPSGAFSHSFGLESYIQEQTVYNKETFFQWLKVYVEKQMCCTEGLACRFVYEALQQNQVDGIWKWDQLLYVQNLPMESREANRRIGERMIRMGIDLYDIPLLADYLARIRSKKAFGHPALAYSIISYYLQIGKKEAILTFLYSNIVTLVQNGVRGIPLGQTDGQRLLLEIQPSLLRVTEKIEALDEDDFGATSPGLEIAQMRHERLSVRLFMS
jgi:urease accessory protein